MPVDKDKYIEIRNELAGKNVTLVAVSKTKTAADIMELYDLGQRDFGENYVQELVTKEAILPKDIRWHFIGHLQSNKAKLIVPFVYLIHGVDSRKLLLEINKQAEKINRVVDCLLQVHIANEETKFGFDEADMQALVTELGETSLQNARILGLMGMASLTEDAAQVTREFTYLHDLYQKYRAAHWHVLSMGMSGDYRTAVANGSTMVRIGSLLFGSRN